MPKFTSWYHDSPATIKKQMSLHKAIFPTVHKAFAESSLIEKGVREESEFGNKQSRPCSSSCSSFKSQANWSIN